MRLLNLIQEPDLKKIRIKDDYSINQCLSTLNSTGFKCLIIENDNDKFLGILVEGDIRRALLKNVSLDSNIKDVFQKKPIILSEKISFDKAKDFLNNHGIDLAPIVINNICLALYVNLPNNIISKTAVIMAGGEGKRLLPLTKKTPKPLIKISKNYSMLELIIKKFKSENFDRLIVTANYLSEKIQKKINSLKNKYNLDISIILETKKLGTGGSLSLLYDKIDQNEFIVTNCDIITDLSYRELLSEHIFKKSFLTMGVYEYSTFCPYGIIKNKFDKFLSIEEKPEFKNLVNMGVYCLSKSSLNLIPKNQYFDLPKVFEIAKKKAKKLILKFIEVFGKI